MSCDNAREQPFRARREFLTRRGFLKTAGAGAACIAGVPYVSWGQRRVEAGDRAEIMDGAAARIEQCRKGSATLTFLGPDGEKLPVGQSLRITQTRHKFLFGCNIFKLGRCRTPEHNTAYEAYFADLLNFATLPFYWWTYERQKGRLFDDRTEEIVRWCKTHDVTTKGHPLAWNWGDPRWLKGTPEEAMRLQMARIDRCVRRFSGDIDIWDVVNEATHYNRAQAKEHAPLLTEAISRMGVGEYLRKAFRAARQANPQATLLINDYRTDPSYGDKVLSLLVDDDGKPLYDVIGLQSHMHGGYWGAGRAWEVCERFAKFGKPLHFTETTVVSGPKKGSAWTTTSEGEQQQADAVAEFYTALFSHPAVEAVTWWDFTDQNAWQGAPAGLLRDDMTPKPAYGRLRDLVKGKWWTKKRAETDAEGKVAFRGFLGCYEVETNLGNQRLTGRFSLDRAGDASVRVRLT